MIRAICAAAILGMATWSSTNLGLARSPADPLNHDSILQNIHQSSIDLKTMDYPYASIAAQSVDIVPATIWPLSLERIAHDNALVISARPIARPVLAISARPESKPQNLANITQPPTSLRGQTQHICIAVALYHEARNQSVMGQRAVASVILERARHPQKWGSTPCEVVRPTQFSFMTSRYGFDPITDMQSWEEAMEIAENMLKSGPLRQLNGANHYHTTDVKPEWSSRMKRVDIIDDHIFYDDQSMIVASR